MPIKHAILLLLSFLCFAVNADAQCGVKCGSERWAVKTLTDRKVKNVRSSPVKRRSISWLRSREEPAEDGKSNTNRLTGIETITFKVRAVIQGHVRESDRD